MSRQSMNKAYLKSICDQIRQVPKIAAVEVAVRIYIKAIESTAVDSGQAVLNWRLQPYVGSVSYEQQRMMWGYGSVAPVSPAGFKYSGGANENIRLHAIEGAFVSSAILREQKFDGIAVYNPIEPGFGSFAPGNDEFYFINAFGQVANQWSSIISEAIDEGERATAAQFDFVTVGA